MGAGGGTLSAASADSGPVLGLFLSLLAAQKLLKLRLSRFRGRLSRSSTSQRDV